MNLLLLQLQLLLLQEFDNRQHIMVIQLGEAHSYREEAVGDYCGGCPTGNIGRELPQHEIDVVI
jgi:hypothetical protein